MLPRDLLHALSARRKDAQPQQHSPDAVLFAHMIAACACALLAAQRDAPGIEQIAKEFPAGRRS